MWIFNAKRKLIIFPHWITHITEFIEIYTAKDWRENNKIMWSPTHIQVTGMSTVSSSEHIYIIVITAEYKPTYRICSIQRDAIWFIYIHIFFCRRYDVEIKFAQSEINSEKYIYFVFSLRICVVQSEIVRVCFFISFLLWFFFFDRIELYGYECESASNAFTYGAYGRTNEQTTITMVRAPNQLNYIWTFTFQLLLCWYRDGCMCVCVCVGRSHWTNIEGTQCTGCHAMC